MKNFIIALIVIFNFANSYSQSNLKGTIHLNAMVGGLTGSSNSEDDKPDSKFKYTIRGSNFGAQFQYALEDSFSVGIGLESNTVKLRVKDVTNNLNDPTLNIIKVSLSGRFYLLNIDKVNIFVGPTIGFASGRNKANTSNVGVFLPNLDTLTRYSGLNYGINAGANYYFTDSLGFIFQLSYESSNLKSTLSQTGNPDVFGTTKLNGLNISGGIAFKF